MTEDIDKIWQQVVSGDHRAWRELVGRYAPLVITVARRVGLSGPDAEDCVQHTWMALYRHRRVIKDPARLPAWLIKTTQRRAVRTLQRLNRDVDLDFNLEPENPGPLPDEEIVRLERQAILEIALDKLDPRCGRLLRALFFAPEDKSYREIAKDLAVSPNALGPLRSRCLKRLEKILKEMGYLPD